MPSLVVASFSYNPQTKDLTINFVTGLIYRYRSVPEKVFKEFRASGSKGRYLNFHIKGRYPYKKIESDPSLPKSLPLLRD